MHEQSSDGALESMQLNEKERLQLLNVMEKAKEFDAVNCASPLPSAFTSQELEGQLYKFTNVMRGWQPRFFKLDPKQAVLSYYISEDKKHHAPRGFLHLWGAVISPTDEDSQTFSINGANSEVFKLKALDARERQKWITHLRAAANSVSTSGYTTTSSAPQDTQSVGVAPVGSSSTLSAEPAGTSEHQPLQRSLSSGKKTSLSRILKNTKHSLINSRPPSHRSNCTVPKLKPLTATSSSGKENEEDEVHEALFRVQQLQKDLAKQLEVNYTAIGLTATDKNLLLLKATSLAMTHSLEECVSLLPRSNSSIALPQQPSAITLDPATPPADQLPSNGFSERPATADSDTTHTVTNSNVTTMTSPNKQTEI